MVGEQAQEMQLAHWITTTNISWLNIILPKWTGVWFSIFPTIETLLAQALAAIVVIGSYYAAGHASLFQSDKRGGPHSSTKIPLK